LNLYKGMRMSASMRMMRQDPIVLHRGEEGIALVTTLVILVIMTVLGMGAVAVTALENRIAGFQRTGESATSAAESCMGTSVNVIKRTLPTGAVPGAFYATGSDPVPALAAPTLSGEIMGNLRNDLDTATGSGATGPDYFQNINGYDVRGDIDFLYNTTTFGEDAAGEVAKQTWYYRIDCRAAPPPPAIGAESRLISIYACEYSGGICKAT
jgi:Tfp pilus assembly protein PilX